MRLKRIAVTSIFILALIIMTAEYVVSTHIVTNGFDELERQQVASDVRRVKNEFLREIENLDTFLLDWSSWDDTYAFTHDKNAHYIESNMAQSTFLDQNLNIIMILDDEGRQVFARAIDDDGNEMEQLIHDFQALVRESALPKITPDGGEGGLIILPSGPVIFAKRPILTTRGKGPAAGSIIMARIVMDEDIESISHRLELPLVAIAVGQGLRHSGLPTPIIKLLAGNNNMVTVKDQDTIDGFTLLRDIYGLPALVLNVTEPRQVSHYGRTVALYNTLFTGCVLIVFSFLIYILLQKRVISRVEYLNHQVQNVDTSRETPMHITSSGNDEISQLAQNVNAMLRRIAKDQRALHRAHDDLEQKVAERTMELEDANQELLCLDRAKSHFLSSTSHELRTPLTSILGFIKLMERAFRKHFQPHLNNVDEATKHMGTYLENFKIVRQETERLGRLINDLLDLNKIEAKRIEWRDGNVDAIELVHFAANTSSGQFNDNPDTELIIVTPPSLPTIHVDGDRIHQVLINLLNNAAKFTKQGSVTVAVRDSGEGALEFSVTDTGTGIPKEELDHIFEIFYQAQIDREYYGSPLGTGLGLAICKEIVEHYGGKIWVESKAGEGSSFKFLIPLQTPTTGEDHETD